MRIFQKMTLGVIFIFSLMAVSGCIPLIIGAAAGAGGAMYIKGALVQNVDDNVANIHRATLAALKEMEIFVTADELSEHTALINAEYLDGKKVRIKVKALTEYVSEVNIRIGSIGDPDESQYILSAIEKEL